MKGDKKRILVLCGYIDRELEHSIQPVLNKPIEQSANQFQRKLIEGLCSNNEICSLNILSAPFIGSYPHGSRCFSFKTEQNSKYVTYVPFNNLWGFRNLSRAKALKKHIKSLESHGELGDYLIIYCPHTPFLEAAAYAKKLNPNLKVCMIVPDLPQYMNLNSNKSLLYDFAKKIDIKLFDNLNRYIDSYVLLTEEMTELLDVGNKPYIVREGITDSGLTVNKPNKMQGQFKDIVYTGKLNESFGICCLIDAFRLLNAEDLRLVICGAGDAENYVRQAALEDRRIFFAGSVDADIARSYQENASVLVNPRLPKESFTRYSFPSKNIEYLSKDIPVVAYFLPGMPPEYKKMFFTPTDETPLGLSKALSDALASQPADRKSMRDCADKRLRLLTKDKFVSDLLEMMST